MFHHQLRLIVSFALIAVVPATSASVFAKGKPNNEQPRPPIYYDVTWVEEIDQYDRLFFYDVADSGTTIVGTGFVGETQHAISIDVSTGIVTDLNQLISDLDASQLPPGWQPTWRLTTARHLNSDGTFAGNVTDQNGFRRPYKYDPNATNPISVFGQVGTSTYYPHVKDMNDAGDVLYAQQIGDGPTTYHIHTFDGQTVDLDAGLESVTALNVDRVVVGNVSHPDSAYIGAYTYDVGTDVMTNIPPYFQARDINNQGIVAGGGSLTGQGNVNIEAVHYSADDGKWLLDENGSNSWATTINNAGQSSGRINIRDRKVPDTSFIYDPVEGFWSINDLINDTPEDTSIWFAGKIVYNVPDVSAISEPLADGFPLMVGSKTVPASHHPSGEDTEVAFILTPFTLASANGSPVPEPTGLVLLTTALVVLGRWRRNRSLNRPARSMGQQELRTKC